ncbi:MAG: F0F1 ATP synthase subunit I [Candidatus Endonucleobacter sp. (ex Gigantidas childressi)]|nr:F0F1 ATP synthase subunit I [Candidatus Endonucleobacter sp. (ex Gigantidas childressi)]
MSTAFVAHEITKKKGIEVGGKNTSDTKVLDWKKYLWKTRTRNLAYNRDYSHLRQPAMHRVIVVQLVTSILLAVSGLSVGVSTAQSVFIGGLCCCIPNAFFVWKAFRYKGARSSRKVLVSFYQGEVGKLVLTITAFTLVFKLIKTVEPMALFGAFFVVQLTNWLAPFLIKQ